ncbi:hypothetical protein SG34_028020 [Thalassomonas viridans]|uniref:Tail specific protease domain-containing protein n=1 Tax=Thalassomonas viridans TaxID=137584 RepID=A0AAF0C952_9GAMM|nr:S41 family peptidase [Thalassomonas viridans]WDE05101.1 hypothetical protein SG34_028020 [Thalassomonas viridans]
MLKKLLITIMLGLATLPAAANTLARLGAQLQPEQIRQDLASWLEWLDKTHPDLAYTTKDIEKFYLDVAALKNGDKPLTVLEFWRRVTALNSQLSDGHTGITFDSTKALTREFVEEGGAVFPFSLVFNDDKLVITGKLDGQPSNLKGYAIEKINGVAIENVLHPLLKRLHGDSQRQRKALLAKRFASYYWLYFGEAENFVIDVTDESEKVTIRDISIAASRAPFGSKKSFEQTYQFEVLDPQTAKLTLKIFNWPDKERYFAFMEKAFKEMKTLNIKKLIIDIRENGGGDDDMWKQGIVSYIADKPWRHGSTYKVKIIEGRESETQRLGEVIDGELKANNQVDHENPYRFTGEVYVLIGAYTYSSSILFANTVQDHGFATLVGEPTGGKSDQTGGLQNYLLPHSQLAVFAPRFLLARPKGGHHMEPVIPDIAIAYDKIRPQQLVDKLMQTW